ncbi:hypothetical protein OPV22_007663 [Ensete ventricosum]|uniref:Uncharacterized protein n=1 Tax=Ensete ventricosum TaxID=4639 RepID=A0AAV8RP00_ENSVE|nr:hypothetical protein OPV22_007663 [Ensete ventricosum]
MGIAIVRLKKHGVRFEIACYYNKVLSGRSRVQRRASSCREGKRMSKLNVLIQSPWWLMHEIHFIADSSKSLKKQWKVEHRSHVWLMWKQTAYLKADLKEY